jgi:hypothetical protein
MMLREVMSAVPFRLVLFTFAVERQLNGGHLVLVLTGKVTESLDTTPDEMKITRAPSLSSYCFVSLRDAVFV